MKINKSIFTVCALICSMHVYADQQDPEAQNPPLAHAVDPYSALSESDRMRQQSKLLEEKIALAKLQKVYEELTKKQQEDPSAPLIVPTQDDTEIRELKSKLELLAEEVEAQQQQINSQKSQLISIPAAISNAEKKTGSQTPKINGIYLTQVVGFQDNPMASFSVNGYLFEDTKAGDYLTESVRILSIHSNYAIISDGTVAQRVYVTNKSQLLKIEEQVERSSSSAIPGLYSSDILK